MDEKDELNQRGEGSKWKLYENASEDERHSTQAMINNSDLHVRI